MRSKAKRERRMGAIPRWLECLLSTTFFNACPSHKQAPRSECNMFCLDCSHSSSFCFYCRSNKHHHHHVIQIRRSSYHDVVRVAEIENVLDISEVQTYVINSARVLFLNERPQPKSSTSKGGSHVCEICSRSLLDPFRFCSLGCKVIGIKTNNNSRFYSRGKNNEEVLGRRLGSKEEDEEEEEDEEGLRVGRNEEEGEIYQNHTLSSHSNSRRRKGIPQRAPF
ncbi:protein RGF1 INDUCIBLE TRANSCRIPTION FACTOR 1 [Cucumis melo]|uniref:Protein RGF1 INDUCIBLE TRANSCRIPTION FACTOR 1 n=1 Tax=Cucumis melo TaxID=3656 RepID=A0A1S3CGK9_CUCME|nr:protein RGF1 INDUCIBLE TRANSCRIPTION FACTOR 1 [Cucumis melo]